MESIVIYPESKTQQSLLKKLFKEMRIRFEVAAKQDTLDKSDEYDKNLSCP